MPPYLTPLQIVENYKKANPQKCKGKSTTEICQMAGLSDKQIAELKTTSAWLFCLDKENSSINQDFSMTELFGGEFKLNVVTKKHQTQKREDIKQEINVNDYTYEALEKQYDSSKYNVTKEKYVTMDVIKVTRKSDNEIVMQVMKVDDTAPTIGIKTNAGSELKIYDMAGQSTDITFKNVEQFFKILESSDKNSKVNELEKLLNKFSKDNISCLTAMQKHDEKIFSTIMKTRSMNIDDRIKIVRQIYDKLYKNLEMNGISSTFFKQEVEKEIIKQKNKLLPADGSELDVLAWRILHFSNFVKNNPEKPANGTIDADFTQGFVGDCWALAGIKALAMNKKGLEILNNSLKLDNNGDIKVTLKGVNKTYTITKAEIEKYKSKYSYGDADVRALEIAIDKYMLENSDNLLGYIDNNMEKDINGNSTTLLYYLLTGKGKENIFGHAVQVIDGFVHTDKEIDEYNKQNKIIVAATSPFINTKYINEGKDLIMSSHAYTVVKSDKDYVYLINPHNTSRTFPITRSDYKKYFSQTSEMEL